MPWQLLALVTATSDAARILISKKTVKDRSPLAVTFYMNVVVFVCLLPILVDEMPAVLNSTFCKSAIFVGIFNSLAVLFYNMALKESDVSLSVPIISFTPLFLLFLSPLILNEIPSASGILGVLLIVVGAYTLQISKRNDGVFAPFKALFSQKGPQYMLIVALIYSVTSNYDKVGVLNSSPIFWVGTIALLRSVFLGIFYIIERNRGKIKVDKKLVSGSILAGLAQLVLLVCQMAAIKLGPVAYVISIKRFSMVLATLYGCLILKEDGFKERVFGTLVMFCGLLVVILLS